MAAGGDAGPAAAAAAAENTAAVTAAKAALRAGMKALSAGVPAAEWKRWGERAAAFLPGVPEFAGADLVAAFLSMPGEIDTAPCIREAFRAGKRVAVPRIEGGDLRFVYLPSGTDAAAWDGTGWPRDRWGIPVPPEAAPGPAFGGPGAARIFVLAPGLAFSPRGARLGRGRGYYDRFLKRVRATAGAGGAVTACALACAFQLLPSVPSGPDDEPMDMILTENGIVRVVR